MQTAASTDGETSFSFQKAMVVVISTSSHLKSITGNPLHTHEAGFFMTDNCEYLIQKHSDYNL
jgi:hypothetical protein